jgi:hypothetical protein
MYCIGNADRCSKPMGVLVVCSEWGHGIGREVKGVEMTGHQRYSTEKKSWTTATLTLMPFSRPHE